MPSRRVVVLDTTLRDGDQAAGFAFPLRDKLHIAHALAAAGVDIIEAGFPLSSAADAEACALIAREFSAGTGSPAIAAMCRSIPGEIRETARILAPARRSLLHLSLPVSDLHIRVKLGLDRAALLSRAIESVSLAVGLAGEIEMGAEDASRADVPFLAEYCDAVTRAGARVVNIADTVGHALPAEFAGRIAYLKRTVPAFRDGAARISVHCHNDLSLAVANTLAAVSAGADQIEVSALGVGERAGNAALEEIAAVFDARADSLAVKTGLVLSAIAPLARLVFSCAGTALSPFKPVTGSNVRAHASGIHQHGISVDAQTYQSVNFARFGTGDERIVLSRHSGRSGVESAALRYAGIQLSSERATRLLDRIKKDLGSDGSAYGVTEFLLLLQVEECLDVPLVRCVSLRVSSTERHVSMRARFSVSVPHTRAKAIHGTGRGYSISEAAVDLVNRVCRTDLSIHSLSLSSYGSGTVMRHRAYLEIRSASCMDRIFAVERVGTDRESILVSALLDAANSLRRPSR